jgi:hypothetical protein
VTRGVEGKSPIRWNLIDGYPDDNAEADGGKRRGHTLEMDGAAIGHKNTVAHTGLRVLHLSRRDQVVRSSATTGMTRFVRVS